MTKSRGQIDEENGLTMVTEGVQKRIQKTYTEERKRQIIEQAEIVGNRQASREFGCAESTIRDWRKKASGIPRGRRATSSAEFAPSGSSTPRAKSAPSPTIRLSRSPYSITTMDLPTTPQPQSLPKPIPVLPVPFGLNMILRDSLYFSYLLIQASQRAHLAQGRPYFPPSIYYLNPFSEKLLPSPVSSLESPSSVLSWPTSVLSSPIGNGAEQELSPLNNGRCFSSESPNLTSSPSFTFESPFDLSSRMSRRKNPSPKKFAGILG